MNLEANCHVTALFSDYVQKVLKMQKLVAEDEMADVEILG